MLVCYSKDTIKELLWHLPKSYLLSQKHFINYGTMILRQILCQSHTEINILFLITVVNGSSFKKLPSNFGLDLRL